MKWKKQKDNINNCGQVALSVITGLSLKKIVKLIGHNSYTKTKELAKVLNKLNYKCSYRLRRLKIQPKLAIAKLTFPNNQNWHWVVIYKDKIYDGAFGNKDGTVNWNKKWKITSYLPIIKGKIINIT